MVDERIHHYIVVGNTGRKIIMKTLAGTFTQLSDQQFFGTPPTKIHWGTNFVVSPTAL
jgi:hypothetical protein